MYLNQKTEYYLADIDTLVPYARNARTHSPEQVAQIAASIREFGFLSPVVTTKDGTILCGHGRFYAAQKLGLKKIPCIREDHLTEAQRRAYIIADNKLSLNAGWDEEILRVELSDLKGEDFDVSLTGFDEKELARLFAEEDGAEEDGFDVDAELEKPCFSKVGDVWHLGRHTVVCGDSTKPETYTRLLGKEKVNLVCTDPPYLVNLESTSGKIKNDDLSDEEGYKFLRAAFEQFHEAMAKDASIYVFYATAKARVFHDALRTQASRSERGLSGRRTVSCSRARTGSTSMSRSSGAGARTASTSGTEIRNR